ncbi:MAG: hypothetical protein H7A25_17210 [Leptospiraceae bacterium]|nr:hypothetical protein [Leptospiraceae bacterium]
MNKIFSDKQEGSLPHFVYEKSFSEIADEMKYDPKFYYLKDKSFRKKFELLYNKYGPELEKYGISIKSYFEYTREEMKRMKKPSLTRTTDYYSDSDFKFLEKFLQDLIHNLDKSS